MKNINQNSFNGLLSLLALRLTISTLCLFGASYSAYGQIEGYAELHSHMFAEHSFGGSWFHGELDGTEQSAVHRCDGNFFSQSHAATRFGPVSEFVGDYNGVSSGDTGIHMGKRNGFDTRRCRYFFGRPIGGTCPTENYVGWPAWDSIAHQQMWEGWIRDAHDRGLKILVASMVESNLLCEVTPASKRRYNCDEMESVERQLQLANTFVQNNSSWVDIALSSSHARQIVAQGKLALVLSVEVTNIFANQNYLQKLQQLHSQGVRSIQIVHHADSDFSGAVPIPRLVQIAGLAEQGSSIIDSNWSSGNGIHTQIDNVVCRNSAGVVGTCDGQTFLNEKGLSAAGHALVNKMIELDMIVDIAHMSRKGIIDIYNKFKLIDYPMFYSHAHFWDTIDDSMEKHEKFITPPEIDMIVETQGMVGLRTGPEKTVNYNGTGVGDWCDGSSYSFAQSLAYGIDQGLNVGFGSDFNGFIQQIMPRKGNGACWGIQTQANDMAGSPDTNSKFDTEGLGHVGLLPELIEDLQIIGLENRYIVHINNSAETFVKLWHRAESAN